MFLLFLPRNYRGRASTLKILGGAGGGHAPAKAYWTNSTLIDLPQHHTIGNPNIMVKFIAPVKLSTDDELHVFC